MPQKGTWNQPTKFHRSHDSVCNRFNHRGDPHSTLFPVTWKGWPFQKLKEDSNILCLSARSKKKLAQRRASSKRMGNMLHTLLTRIYYNLKTKCSLNLKMLMWSLIWRRYYTSQPRKLSRDFTTSKWITEKMQHLTSWWITNQASAN